MSLLELKDLSYKYDGTKKQVLDGINATFEAGKVYAVVGKSGSGKTTLLSLISGLDVCTGGEIKYKGANLKSMNRDHYRAKSIGVIFQGYNLLTNATGVENIILSMEISGSDIKDKKAFAYELLEKVGIDRETADRKVLKLSGGEQQRVGIARAISHNPDIIIADEPTGNLDTDTESEVLEILTSLAHKNGKCVVIVTHSKKVSSCADETWRMVDGTLLLQGDLRTNLIEIDDEEKAEESVQTEKNEIKNMKRKIQNVRVFIISFCIIVMITGGIVGGIQLNKYLDKQSKSYIMTFEGHKVSVEDLKLYTLMLGSGDDAQNKGLAALTNFLVLNKTAKEKGIALTEEEKAAALANARNLKENLVSYGLPKLNMTDERIAEILSESLLANKLIEQLGKDYRIDEADFQKAFEEYRLNGKQFYIDIQLKYVITETEAAADKARELLLSGTAVDDVIKEYSIAYSEDAAIETIGLSEINLGQEIVDRILALKVLGITDVIDLGDQFVVFEVEEINIPTDEELEATSREMYIQNKKVEIYNVEFAKWKAAAVYQTNQKALDALK